MLLLVPEDRRQLQVYRGVLTRVLFAISIFVCLGYYGLIHFDPAHYLKARPPQFWARMHVLHAGPAIFVIGNLLVVPAVTRPDIRDYGVLLGYMLFYTSWLKFCAWMNGGLYPYPFQQGFEFHHHIAFDVVSVLVACGFLSIARAVTRKRLVDKEKRSS